MPQATPAMNDDIASPFRFPAVHRKKVAAAFDGGRLTSDGGVLLLAQAERAMGICRQLDTRKNSGGFRLFVIH